MIAKLVKESLDELSNKSETNSNPSQIYTKEEDMELTKVIKMMLDAGKYRPKLVEMLAFRLKRTPASVRTRIKRLLANDPDSLRILFTSNSMKYSDRRKQERMNKELTKNVKNKNV